MVKKMPSISTTSTELLSRENKKLKKSNTRSDRYDVIYTELPSWDFYDTFIGSVANQEAIKNNELSTTEENLKKYLKIIHQHHKAEIKAASYDPNTALPEYLEKLLALQARCGRFESLWEVSRVLGMPVDLPYRRKDTYKEYEIATAIVVAAIRQHNHLFRVLVEQHDRAMEWVKSNELVYQAREHINNFFGTVDYTSTQSNISLEGSLSSTTTTTTSNAKGMLISENGVSNGLSPIQRGDSTHLLISSTNNLGLTSELQSLSVEDGKVHQDFDALSASIIQDTETSSRPSSPSKADFSNLLSALHTFSGAYSDEDLNIQKQRVADSENKVLNSCLKMESLLVDLTSCLDRCVNAYNASELFMNRHKTFDELTCRLADGFPATPAYSEQWKKEGVPGIRPVIIDVLCEVQTMAEERLTLIEMMTPQGRDWKKKNNIDVNRSRWVLNWHGHNVAMKVLHCLDFLRKCRELCSWYGPAYYFVANPLQLPFPMQKAFAGLAVEPWVKDLLETQPHDRKGLAVVEKKKEWAFQQYLNDFRRRFQSMSKEWSFNWPELPYIRDEEPNFRVCTAVMVLFIACGESIEKSFAWERNFINATSSTRGQATYMIGMGNQRTDKPLKIPTLEERKPRIDLVGHFQDLINKKRERERAIKTEAEALEAARSKSMYTFLLEESDATEDMSSQKDQENQTIENFEDDDYMAILKMNRRRAKRFQEAVDDTGGLLAANVTVTEQAKINPVSAPVPFDYSKQKRISVINPQNTRQSTFKGVVPQSHDSGKRGSLLVKSTTSLSVGNRPTSIMSSTSGRLAPIHEGVNGGMGMRQSISQPSWVTANTAPSNNAPNPTMSTTILASTTTTASSTDLSRKSLVPNPVNSRNVRSPSILRGTPTGQNTNLERKQSHVLTKQPFQAVANPADTIMSGGLMGRSNSILGTTSGEMSTIAPLRKSSVMPSSPPKGDMDEKEAPGTHIEKQHDRARSPSIATVRRSSTKVLDREQLLREGAQSRRVSRLPTMKETTVTVTGGVVNAAGMTKRRPTTNDS